MWPFYTQTEQNEAFLVNWYYLIVYLNVTADNYSAYN